MSEKQISFVRQSRYCDPFVAGGEHVNIVGVGTVGSNVAVCLAKLGVGSLHLVDPDTVADVNIPSQHFALHDIDKPKVDALKTHIEWVNGLTRVSCAQEYLDQYGYLPGGTVVLGVDNMDARKEIMDMLRYRDDVNLVVEARMSGDILQIFALDPTNQDERAKWDKLWYPQSEATMPECGGQSVAYIGDIAGGLISAIIARKWMGQNINFYTGITVGSFISPLDQGEDE